MQEYLSELKNKFGYDDDLLKAIELVINLMIEQYGVQEQSDIYSIFASTEIIDLPKVDREALKGIEGKKRTVNSHIKYAEREDSYLSNSIYSVYNYEPILNGDMKVMDEVRYIVVPDMSDANNRDKYYNLFGTTINVPYLLRGVNQAYAMMHPQYIYEGNKIITKHGIHTSVYEYEKDNDGKYVVNVEHSNDTILEDIIYEIISQKMLGNYFKKNGYSEVSDLLKDIKSVDKAYNKILLNIGEKFHSLIGSNELMSYCRNSEYSPITKFNEIVCQSDIALEYLNGKVPFDYLCAKVYEIFILNTNKYNMDIDDYAYEAAKLMLEAFAPLFAYEEIISKTMSLEKYNKKRDVILAEYSQKNGNGLGSL